MGLVVIAIAVVVVRDLASGLPTTSIREQFQAGNKLRLGLLLPEASLMALLLLLLLSLWILLEKRRRF